MTSDTDTAIAHLRAAVDECLTVDLELVDRDGLLELARQVEMQKRRLPALDHQLVAVLESRGVAGECGATSTAVLLRQLLRISPGEARARVAAAADLGPRRGLTGELLPPLFEHVAAAQAAGVVSVEQAKIITGLIDTLPDQIQAESGQMMEAQLTGFAADLDPIHLGQVAHRVRDYLDPDGTLADDRYKDKHREVTLLTRRDGTHVLSGELDDATHVVWQAILDTLSTPKPGPDGEPDPRHAAQRRHDAFREAGHRLLQAGTLPDSGGIPTTVLLTINADHLTHWLTNQDADRLHELAADLTHTDLPGTELPAGDVSGTDPPKADLSGTDPAGPDCAEQDQRWIADHGDQPAQQHKVPIGQSPTGPVEAPTPDDDPAVRSGLDGTGSGWADELAGSVPGDTDDTRQVRFDSGPRVLDGLCVAALARPNRAVRRAHTQHDHGQEHGQGQGHGSGFAVTAHGDHVSIATALHLATEAQIIPVVCSDSSGVLAYGRTRRLATPSQRLALAARDRGCSFPGCTRPPAWTQAHHIRAWIDDGTTDLDNLTLLCDQHHHTYAATGWQCLILNGHPCWVPPAWLDPQRKPRRNTAHHIDLEFSQIVDVPSDEPDPALV